MRMKKTPTGEKKRRDYSGESDGNPFPKRRKTMATLEESQVLYNTGKIFEERKMLDNISFLFPGEETFSPFDYQNEKKQIQPSLQYNNLAPSPESLNLGQVPRAIVPISLSRGITNSNHRFLGSESLSDNYLMNTLPNPGNIGRESGLSQLLGTSDNRVRAFSEFQGQHDHLFASQQFDTAAALSSRSMLRRQLLENTSSFDNYQRNPLFLSGDINSICQGTRTIDTYRNAEDQALAIARVATMISPGSSLNQSSSTRSVSSTQAPQQMIAAPSSVVLDIEDQIGAVKDLVQERQRQAQDIQQLLASATNRSLDLASMEANFAIRPIRPYNEHAINPSLFNMQSNSLPIAREPGLLQAGGRHASLRNQLLSNDQASMRFATLSKERTGTPSTSIVRRNSKQHPAVDLYMQCDDDILSDYQILLRKQIEFFEAGPAEVQSVSQSRRKAIRIGQVGIRCKHCGKLAPLKQPKGTVYYPSYLRALYQAGQNMATSHFMISCESIDEGCKKQLKTFREGQALVGHGGKKYWEDCAKAVGVTEAIDGGLRFQP
mmetsp:Transcript_25168/g.27742  ORF Transcript_25168/g.27742 Transcript_25168/m.27742 type:complete len:548 (+) Transcript_25168:113-1756(+)